MTEVDAPTARRVVAEKTNLHEPDHPATCCGRLVSAPRVSCCAPRTSKGWAPPRLPADTRLKRLVDRFLPSAGLPLVVYFAAVIGAVNLASLFSTPAAELALEGSAALAGGGWCALNFWRCRHAHCLVTGVGWLGLSLLALVGAGLGHSVVGGYERAVFVVVLVIGCGFEAVWQILHGTNAMSKGLGTGRNGLGR